MCLNFRFKMLPVNKNIINELCMYIDRIFPVETENPIKIFEEESKYIRDWLRNVIDTLQDMRRNFVKR